MKAALENSVPTKLFDLYQVIIDGIRQGQDDTEQLVQKVLSWIYHAKRSLKMDELREAIAVEEGDIGLDEEDLMSAEDIVEICGSLVSYDVESGVMTFSHAKVEEFLGTQCADFILSKLAMANICLDYLSLDIFESPAQDDFLLEERLKKHPFAIYANQYFGMYIKEIDAEDDLETEFKVSKLFESSEKLNALNQLASVEMAVLGDSLYHYETRGQTPLHVFAKHGLSKWVSKTLGKNALDVYPHVHEQFQLIRFKKIHPCRQSLT
jgi:hypothetical protein